MVWIEGKRGFLETREYCTVDTVETYFRQKKRREGNDVLQTVEGRIEGRVLDKRER